jgi:hypothetical protein
VTTLCQPQSNPNISVGRAGCSALANSVFCSADGTSYVECTNGSAQPRAVTSCPGGQRCTPNAVAQVVGDLCSTPCQPPQRRCGYAANGAPRVEVCNASGVFESREDCPVNCNPNGCAQEGYAMCCATAASGGGGATPVNPNQGAGTGTATGTGAGTATGTTPTQPPRQRCSPGELQCDTNWFKYLEARPVIYRCADDGSAYQRLDCRNTLPGSICMSPIDACNGRMNGPACCVR